MTRSGATLRSRALLLALISVFAAGLLSACGSDKQEPGNKQAPTSFVVSEQLRGCSVGIPEDICAGRRVVLRNSWGWEQEIYANADKQKAVAIPGLNLRAPKGSADARKCESSGDAHYCRLQVLSGGLVLERPARRQITSTGALQLERPNLLLFSLDRPKECRWGGIKSTATDAVMLVRQPWLAGSVWLQVYVTLGLDLDAAIEGTAKQSSRCPSEQLIVKQLLRVAENLRVERR